MARYAFDCDRLPRGQVAAFAPMFRRARAVPSALAAMVYPLSWDFQGVVGFLGLANFDPSWDFCPKLPCSGIWRPIIQACTKTQYQSSG